MFDISADWPKTQNFVLTNISDSIPNIEFVDPLPCLRAQIANISTYKVCFKPKSQKNVPANNCHLR